MSALAVTLVTLEVPKVATSDGPSGTVFGIQLAAVSQSPLEGLADQVALPAEANGVVAAQRSAGKQKSSFMAAIEAETASPVEPNEAHRLD